MSETENNTTKIPYGLGGWLGWLQFWIIASIFITVFRESSALIQYNINFADAIRIFFGTFTGILTVLNFGLLITSLVFLWKRSMLFRTLALINYGVVYTLNIVYAIQGFSNWGYVVGYIVGSLLWIAYLFKSERIKNTLRKVGQQKTDYELQAESREAEIIGKSDTIEATEE